MFDKQYFELTENHVKLARKMYLSWFDCEYGAPSIDPKRPYGNGDVVGDIRDILDLAPDLDLEDEYAVENWEEENYEKVNALHEEMEKALQVILSAGSFEPGTYEADEYHVNWKLSDGRT